ncbi:tRNA:m(4)X modification enzyme TRM13 -like protein [Collichthys lucidus]|uniref:tRNA:m(4)X modification enzyme TRM13 n=1 Tax=Collichthys lucidus TaxID=240159 RepID=A0A4U5UKA7_COLLU|nr:tRNA:m(4)X modification enzyme TRM13 -like protein [Collichthys lucidus]
MAAPMPGRCGFFVEKKKRFCKMLVSGGKTYCGEHATVEVGSRRIACPLDPKHTVSEDKLDKHLKRCNSREKAKPVYYVENINSGSGDTDEALQQLTRTQVSLSEHSRTQLEALLDKLKAAVTGEFTCGVQLWCSAVEFTCGVQLWCSAVVFTCGDAGGDDVIVVVGLPCDVEDSVLSHPVLQEELHNPKNGDSAHKHLKQQSSILGHLDALGLLSRGRCFVEFGAGRGKLSHWIHEALKTDDHLKTDDDLQLLLVDGKHQDVGVQFERLQVDIQHLDLSKVPLLTQKKLPLVGVGKHLCGAATDLALRCLLETPRPKSETEPPRKRLKTSEAADPAALPETDPGLDCGPGPVLGLAVALCCHHRCEWRHYVGQQFFLQRGLGAKEFSAFCRMSSWATCGLRPTNQDPPPPDPTNQDHLLIRPIRTLHLLIRPIREKKSMKQQKSPTLFLSAAERERVGRLCKHLIDAGRLHFLKTKGFDSKLRRYVNAQVTLENVLLTATPSASS